MNDEQLRMLTEEQRIYHGNLDAYHIDYEEALEALTALADARLEVARLTEERDEAVRIATAEHNLRREADAACVEGSKVLAQQREDIRRLSEALEDIQRMATTDPTNLPQKMFAGQISARVTAALPVEMKERYA